MFVDPPRHGHTPGLSSTNKDYFMVTFLWGFSLFAIVVLLCVLTVPYYFHYKRWVFIMCCTLYPLLIILTLVFFLILFCSQRSKPAANTLLLTDKNCQICQQPIHTFQFHSYRPNRCIFPSLLMVYLLFSISYLGMSIFHAGITLDVFIKYCRERSIYQGYLNINPTVKDETFFTVINFLIMVVSFVMICYEPYRIVTVVTRMGRFNRFLKGQREPVQIPKAAQIRPESAGTQKVKETEKNEQLTTQRPLSNPNSNLSYFVHPLKFTDIPFSLRPNERFIPTSS